MLSRVAVSRRGRFADAFSRTAMAAFVVGCGPVLRQHVAVDNPTLALLRPVTSFPPWKSRGTSWLILRTRLTPTSSAAAPSPDDAKDIAPMTANKTEAYLESLEYGQPAAETVGGGTVGGFGGSSPGEGGSGSSGRGEGGGGNWEESDGGVNDENILHDMLARKGLSMRDIPADIVGAYEKGIVGAAVLINFLHAQSNIVSSLLMRAGSGMRSRFLADKLFLLKIAIEEGMGVAGKLTAEYERRRDRFWKEGEFVFANLVTAILADFALVYLPAPSVSLRRVGQQSSWLRKIIAGLPTNIFQTDRPYTLVQRAGGFSLKAAQLFTVGFLCSVVGVALTNGIVYVRERFDKDYKPETEKTNVLAVSALYAVFLGLSSGTRYQIVNGIENRIFPQIFRTTPALVEKMATFLLRYGNTFWGSQQWVIFCRLTNVQKQKSS